MGRNKGKGRAAGRQAEVLDTDLGRVSLQGQYVTWEGPESAEEHAAAVADMLAQRDKLRQDQADRRARLVEILQQADTADLLGTLSLTYATVNPDTYRESESDRSPAHLEYLALQALGVAVQRCEDIDLLRQHSLASEAIYLVREMFRTATWLTLLDAAQARRDRPDDPMADYVLKTRLYAMGVRGTGYPEHLIAVIRGCLDPFEADCRRLLGFTAGEALVLFEAIRSVTAKRMAPRVAEAGPGRREMEQQLKRARRRGDVSGTAFPPEILSMTPTQAKQKIAYLASALLFEDARLLTVVTADDLAAESGLGTVTCQAFLDAFTCPPSEFNLDHHAEPVGAHPMTLRPILDVGDGCLLPSPSTVLEAIRPLIEDALQKDKQAWDRYVALRGEYLEREATRRLASALPGSQSWIGVKWSSPTTNSDLDGLIRADDLGLRVQCKAGRMTAPARRGAPVRMLHHLSELVQSAAEQHTELATQLDAHGAAALGFDPDQVLALTALLQVEIVVCLDDVTVWATQTHELRAIGTLPENRHVPWVLSLPDLMAVTDLLQGGQLGHYLLRRQRLERDGRIETHDELDWVGYYITHGLYFDSFFDTDRAPTVFRVQTFTEDIDNWYFTRAGMRTVAAPKPQQPIPPRLKQLLHDLETRRPDHWMLATIALLDGNEDSRDTWEIGLHHVQGKARKEGWSNVTQVFNGRLGVVVIADNRLVRANLEAMVTSHTHAKAAELDQPNWIGIAEGIAGSLAVAVAEGQPGFGEIFMNPPTHPRARHGDVGVGLSDGIVPAPPG